MHRTTRRLFAGFAAIATIAILWMWLDSDTADRAPQPPSPGPEAPATWGVDTDATREITWEIPEEGPPHWRVTRPSSSDSTARPLELAVERADQPIAWRGVRHDTSIWLVGETTVDGRDLAIHVILSNGNPQARLSVRWDAPPLSERTEPLTIQWRGSEGTTTFLDNELELARAADAVPSSVSAWRPTWIRKTVGNTPVTLRGWTGDGYSVGMSPEEQPSISLKLWDPQQHVNAESCRTVAAPEERADIVASAHVVFGKSTPVVAAPLPRGSRAALSPIFDVPAAHPDATLHIGDARSAQDWVRRTRTLLYGHSSTDDPRYGNGGLLGHNLGGSIVVPSRFADAPAIESLVASVENRAVSFAVRRAETSEGDSISVHDGYATRFASTTDCKPPADSAPTTRVSEQLSGSHGAANLLSEGANRLGSPAHLKPGFLIPTRLDGRRTSFANQTILRGRIEKLVDQRGVAAFTTPLLGSRNPLTATAKEGLLQPERWGEWTLDPEFSSALTDLDHWTDVHPLAVTAPATWISYWRDARKATLHWASDGILQVAGSEAEGIRNFSLLFPESSALSVTVDGDDPKGRLSGGDGGTRIWWDLATNRTHRISAAEDRQLSAPDPVRWVLRD